MADWAFWYLAGAGAFGCVAACDDDMQDELQRDWNDDRVIFILTFCFLMALWPLGVAAILVFNRNEDQQ